jgi:hypothetical protein
MKGHGSKSDRSIDFSLRLELVLFRLAHNVVAYAFKDEQVMKKHAT